MPRRPWRVQKTSPDPSPTTVVTTAETVVATLAGVATDSADSDVILEGSVDITVGANAGPINVVAKIERGAAAGGTQVGGSVTQTIVASSRGSIGITVRDTPGEVSQGYVLTVTQTAATTNGTVNQAELSATF